MNIAMIPARMGSQRLSQKNLRNLCGVPLITRAIRKCFASGAFGEVWVNSEDSRFGAIAKAEGAFFHKRPTELGSNSATSEQFVAEFLRHHRCESLFQVHSIAPLLTTVDIVTFVEKMSSSGCDCLLSYEPVQIECGLAGHPLNFKLTEKTNSQELAPVQRITWSITGWRRASFLSAFDAGKCATYAGTIEWHPVSRFAALVIKTEEDLKMAEALLPLVAGNT